MIDHEAHAKWEGAAQAFSNIIKKATRLLITANKHIALSRYGQRGYGAYYSDHLDRINEAIKLLEHSREYFIQAEALRRRIETPEDQEQGQG